MFKSKLFFKVIIPLIITTLILGLASYLFIMYSQNKIFRIQVKNRFLQKQMEINNLIKITEKTNLKIASIFSKNVIVQRAYKIAYKGDISDQDSKYSQQARVYLRKSLKNILHSYKEFNNQTLNLHFHLPPATSLVRLWRKKQAKRNGKWIDISDNLTSFRHTIKYINKGKVKKISGIEIGRGGFAIRGICAVFDKKRKIIGSVEVLTSFNNILKKNSGINNEGYFVFMNHDFLKIATKLDNKSKYPVINNEFVKVYSSRKIGFNNKINHLIKARTIPNMFQAGNMFFWSFPIKDYNGKVIGVFVYSSDYSKNLKAIRNMGIIIISAFAAFLIINFFIMTLLIYKVILKPFSVISKVVSENAKGNLTKTIDILKNVNCSNIMKCNKTDCVDYGKDKVLCFLDVGSHAPSMGKEIMCPTILSGKIENCEQCKVYKMIAKDEIKLFASWYNKMIENLKEMISDLKLSGRKIQDRILSLTAALEQSSATVEEFSSISDHIMSSAKFQNQSVDNAEKTVDTAMQNIKNISESIDTQATSIEQFSSTIEQMTFSIKSVANTSENAKGIAQKLNRTISQNREVIELVVHAVNGVEQSSKQINEILNVITDITEQTNLLAMNAAIEAAHAGTYGKGFAIVAQEIRKLAENSSVSSKEIKKHIDNIIKEINTTVELSNKANASLNAMINDVISAENINTEIFVSTQEQANGVNDILQAITEIKSLTRKVKESLGFINNDGGKTLQAMDEVKNLSEQVTNSTEEQNLGTKQLLEAVVEENQAIEEIKDIVDELHSRMNKFVIDNSVLSDKLVEFNSK